MTAPSGPGRQRGAASRGLAPTALLAAALVAGALCAGCGGPPDSSGPSVTAEPWFVESAGERGLSFSHRSGFGGRFLFPEIMPGGGALFDMDGDGDLDAYLVQSGSLVRPEDEPDGNRLFENVGAGSFRDVTDGSGAGDRGYGFGATAGDYDADGDTDLYVTNYGPNVLLRNDGHGRFTDVSRASGTDHDGWGVSTAFVDYDDDGDLDLFVVNYVNWTIDTEQDCYNTAGQLDYCLPNNYNAPARDLLLRNEGDGTFTDVTERVGIDAAFGNGLGIVCGDFSGDGRTDVFVSNDTMMNQLWINQGDGTFRDESLLRGCALDEHGLSKAGMGTTAGDYDDDGDLDLLVVNLDGQTDSFFRNDGGFFSDSTGSVGLGTVSRRFTRFGLGLVDLDNDGWLDLFQANGRVVLSVEPGAEDPFAESNLVFKGDAEGRFVEVLPRGGTADELLATSRAAVFGDVDDDGGMDVLVVNRDGPAHLLLNRVPQRSTWIGLRVLDRGGRDALGASVTLELAGRQVTRDVRSAYSYCASNDPRVHVGLGGAVRADRITVRWVDGTLESFDGGDAGAYRTLRRGTGRPAR